MTYPRATLISVSSALLALAPKCPICFLAYFGIFGVATSSASAYRSWLPAVTGVWLALTVATFALRMDKKRIYGPVAVGIVAGLSVFSGKFIVESQLLLYAGIAALFIAAGWSAWSRTSAARTSCSQCETQPQFTQQGTQVGS